MTSEWKRYLWLGVIAVAIVVGVLIGSHVNLGTHAKATAYAELDDFAKVLHFVEENYVEEVDSKKLIYGGIKGMLRALDPHSSYLPAKFYKEMQEETSGKFGGLGIEVTVLDGSVVVVAPIEDSPAFKAGLKSRDKIVSIAGKNTKKLTFAEAIDLMRGEPGTKVKMMIVRGDDPKAFEVVVTREQIKTHSVKYALIKEKYGYLRISSFMERTAHELVKAVHSIRRESSNLKGFILDLRGNPGGLLDQAVKVANVFLEEGPVVYTIGRDKAKREVSYAQKGFQKVTEPVVVLVDGGSASASEIVAGALQDYGRGIIAGKKTFGKGSVQSIVPIGKESGLKLTIARYYTPSGKSIQATGIEPNIELEEISQDIIAMAKEKAKGGLREADLDGHISNEHRAKEAQAKNSEIFLKFEEKVAKDYMVHQAIGLLRTVALTKVGAQLPEFKPPFNVAKKAKDEDKSKKDK